MDVEDDVDYKGAIPGEYEAEEIYPEKYSLEQMMDKLTESSPEPVSLRKEDYNIHVEKPDTTDDVTPQPETTGLPYDPREFPTGIPDTRRFTKDQLFVFLDLVLSYVSGIVSARLSKGYVDVGTDINIDLLDEQLTFDILHKVYHAGSLLGQFTKIGNRLEILCMSDAYQFRRYRLPKLISEYQNEIRAFLLRYGYHVKFQFDYAMATVVVFVRYTDTFSDKMFRITHARLIRLINEMIDRDRFYKESAHNLVITETRE